MNILIIIFLSIPILFAEKNKKENKVYFYAAYNRSSLIELTKLMASLRSEESMYKIKPQSRLQIGLKKRMGSFILGTGISRRGGMIKRHEVQGTTIDLDGNEISFQVWPAATIIYYITNIDVFFRFPYKIGPGQIWAQINLGYNLVANERYITDVENYNPAFKTISSKSNLEDAKFDYGFGAGYTLIIDDGLEFFAAYYLGLASIGYSTSIQSQYIYNTGWFFGFHYKLEDMWELLLF